jgi:hypothetical protein
VKKTRAKSAPGPNGVPYLVYKCCPRVLAKQHLAWGKGVICNKWKRPDGVYIPKETKSSELSQFRPISLLNVEWKIVFAVLARRHKLLNGKRVR